MKMTFEIDTENRISIAQLYDIAVSLYQGANPDAVVKLFFPKQEELKEEDLKQKL